MATTHGEHAVVIGASMAGLLAARTLSRFYSTVTLVDRDELPVEVANRKGVPQGRHAHALSAGGGPVLEALFPGLLDDLVAGGAPVLRNLSELYFSPALGLPLAQADVAWDPPTFMTSRPYLEHHVRARLRAQPGVEFRQQCEVIGLTTAPDCDRVTGVRVASLGHGGDELDTVLSADLVVDASGRGSRVPVWLSEMGHPQPTVQELQVHVRYASQRLRPGTGYIGREKLVLIGPEPGRSTGMALGLCEDGHWLLTLITYGAASAPPTESPDRLDFVRRMAPARVFCALRDAEPVGAVDTYRFRSNYRRRYDQLTRFPDGLLVLGDAMCSFNPVYGQGMTVAALEAQILGRILARGQHDLGRRFFRETASTVEFAWRTASGGDLALPEVVGARPLGLRAVNAYIGWLLASAEHDPALTVRFLRVPVFVDPPWKLLHPALITRGLLGVFRRARRSTAGTPEPADRGGSSPAGDNASSVSG